MKKFTQMWNYDEVNRIFSELAYEEDQEFIPFKDLYLLMRMVFEQTEFGMLEDEKDTENFFQKENSHQRMQQAAGQFFEENGLGQNINPNDQSQMVSKQDCYTFISDFITKNDLQIFTTAEEKFR